MDNNIAGLARCTRKPTRSCNRLASLADKLLVVKNLISRKNDRFFAPDEGQPQGVAPTPGLPGLSYKYLNKINQAFCPRQFYGIIFTQVLIIALLVSGTSFAGTSFAGTSFAGTSFTEDLLVTHIKEKINVKARVERITEKHRAVGTIKPRMETKIESQIRAQVKQVHVTSGDDVKKGELLITLDARQPKARFTRTEQALQGVRASKKQAWESIQSARAAYKEAKQRYKRIKGYYDSSAATKQELESAESFWLQAKAGLSRANQARKEAEAGIKQAEQALKEAEIELGFTKIIAPFKGRVIKKMVESGDLALPGRPLVTIRTETGFRIEAHVQEGMINRVKKGMELEAEITSLGKTCKATVEEIIPYADPETRTFLVKAAIPVLPGLYPGMYGKLLIPEARKDVVLVPVHAVMEIGQLDIVMVKEKDKFHRRYVKTGRVMGEMVEILSGLKGGETLKGGVK
ncbi:MAG: efflux RND transporter periplasmic adaptor subunit [Thermodesulfobacteriota bacterium]|nr:efflux RND transporter periplasmic adaptor subunit [Thermodesulfobacteriota bacterium]